MTSDCRELTRELATHGHQVTVYAQKHQPDLPDQAELHDGVRVEHISAGPVPARATVSRATPACWSGSLLSAARCAAAGKRAPRCRARAALDERPGGAGRRARPGHPGRAGVQLARRHRTARPGEGGRRAAARIRLEPAIGRSAAAVVATHAAEASDLASLGVHRSSIRVVPWGVDTDTFTPEGPVAKRNGRPRLLTAADLNERAPLRDPAAGADQGTRRGTADRRRA